MLSHVQNASDSDRADMALERMALCLVERTIDPRRDAVTVRVEDGWATVTGAVASATRRCDVERHVRSLAGIRGLTNEIAIQTSSPVVAFGWGPAD